MEPLTIFGAVFGSLLSKTGASSSRASRGPMRLHGFKMVYNGYMIGLYTS